MVATGTLGKVLLIRHIADGRLDRRARQSSSLNPPRLRSTVGYSTSRCERMERPRFCNGLSHSVAPDSVFGADYASFRILDGVCVAADVFDHLPFSAFTTVAALPHHMPFTCSCPRGQ